MSTATQTHVKTLDSLTIIVREWFDKTYGNTYHSAAVVANGELVHTFLRTYGHGEQFILNRTNGILRELGYEVPQGPAWNPDEAYSREYRLAGIPLHIDTASVTRRQDLHQ